MTGPATPLAEQWAAGHRAHAGEAEKRIEVATRCLRLITEIVSLDDVVDFGCGIGAWLVAAQRLGASRVAGFEGAYIKDSPVVVAREVIRIADLASERFNLDKRHSLAITIEVAEHLPDGAAEGFIESLVSASDFILFSAARPGQGGLGHVNEQPLMYWLRKFWHFGYVPIDPIRPFVARDTFIYPWIRQNIVMFVNYDVAIRSPAVMRFARPLPDFHLHYQPRTDFKRF